LKEDPYKGDEVEASEEADETRQLDDPKELSPPGSNEERERMRLNSAAEMNSDINHLSSAMLSNRYSHFSRDLTANQVLIGRQGRETHRMNLTKGPPRSFRRDTVRSPKYLP